MTVFWHHCLSFVCSCNGKDGGGVDEGALALLAILPCLLTDNNSSGGGKADDALALLAVPHLLT